MSINRVGWIEEKIRHHLASGPMERRVLQQKVKQRNSTAADFHRAIANLVRTGAVEEVGSRVTLIDTRPAKTLVQFRYEVS